MINQLLYGDNIEIMRRMQSASIDVIQIDPPFNSNRNYNFLYSQATGRDLPEEAEAFCDAWTLDIAKEEKIREMADEMLKGGNSEFIEFWQNQILALRKTKLLFIASYTEFAKYFYKLAKFITKLHCKF